VIEPKIPHDEIFRNFICTQENKPFLSELYADYLASYILSGELYPGHLFPSVKELHEQNSLPYHVINEALKLLKSKGLIKTGRGIKTHVSQTKPAVKTNNDASLPLYADCHYLPYCSDTASIIKKYHKTKFYYSSIVPPQQENVISEELIDTLCINFNQLHHKQYTNENFLYVNSCFYLMRAIGRAIWEKNSVIVIPEKASTQLRNALKFEKLNTVTVKSDGEGIDIKDLDLICTQYKVTGVVIMSVANFPDCKAMSEKRISDLFQTQNLYGFKIIENNFYEPWLYNQQNKVLNGASNSLDTIIYIYPLNYFIKDISHLRAVAADTITIQKIKSHLVTHEVEWNYSLARSACSTLLLQEYATTCTNLRAQLHYSITMIRNVFSATNFWDAHGLNQDAGMAFLLRPREGSFPTHAVARLHEYGIQVYHPEIYMGDISQGLRIDLSYYLTSKTLETKVKKLERITRKICMEG
jgi:DNA-binding transcriptional regulator YhcF (GntR family)